MHKPAHVANSFLYQAKIDGVSNMDQLKVQKLVYCLHGWNLAVTGKPVVGEFFEAWPYGPVLSSLYSQFKSYGKRDIDAYAIALDPSTGEEAVQVVSLQDREFMNIFNPVWARYKNLTGLQLSALTHAPGTPWTEARRSGFGYIPNEQIRDHFISLARSNQNDPA